MEYGNVLNCDALLLLERLEDSSAALIYFDPPIGSFIGSNDEDKSANQELRSLYLYSACYAKKILCKSGVLVWHAVPDHSTEVRNNLNRIFGPHQFAIEIVLKRRLPPFKMKNPTSDHSSLIVYTKSDDFYYCEPTEPYSDNLGIFIKEDDKGSFKLANLMSPGAHPDRQFSWQGFTPPAGQSWRYNLNRLEELRLNGSILLKKNQFPREKIYLKDQMKKIGSVWDDIDLQPLERISGNPVGQQSIKLMTRVISMFTQEGDIIIDPFCGTGTTLVAAQRLHRKWLGADCSAEACDYTKSRLKKETEYDCSLRSEDYIRKYDKKHNISDILTETPPVDITSQIDIYDLIGSGESKTLEFKQTLSLDVKTNEKQKYIEQSSLKTIAGFLNSDGGTLLIGVNDDQEITGINSELSAYYKDSVDKFLLHFKNIFKSNIGEEFYPLVDYNTFEIDEKRIFRIDCKPSDIPCFIGDDFYVRATPATDRLTGQSLLKYWAKRFPAYKG